MKFDKAAEFSRSVKTDPAKWNLIIVKVILQCCQLWPEDQNAITCIGFVHFVDFFIILMAQSAYFIHNITDLTVVTSTFAVTAGISQVCAKMVTLIIYKKKLRKILNRVWFEFLPVDVAEESAQRKIYNQIYLYRKLIYAFAGIGIFTVIEFVSVAIIIGKGGLPLVSLYPFDWHHPPWYEFLYLWQWVTCFGALFSLVGYDLLFITLIGNCVAQFEIINSTLSTIGSDNDKQKIKYISKFASQHNPKWSLDHQMVTKCIEHHTMLIRTCSEIEQAFMYVMLIQLLTGIVSICLSCFAMTQQANQMGQLITYLSLMLSEIALFCWAGNELTHQAASVSEAAFQSHWYGRPEQDVSKALILIIQRANEETAITAAGFARLNLNCLVQVLKFSASVYTLLGNIMERNRPAKH